jgi:protocatechuate 3,4-dioxygenase beta subunit
MAEDEKRFLLSRRALLIGGAAAFVAACSRGGRNEAAGTASPAGAAPGTRLTPTPACDDGDEPTIEQTEGPYFTPDSPEKSDFTGDVSDGTRMILTGTVLSTSCEPVQRALLDFWHADDSGEYDNEGYNLRGHMFTDANGTYRLQTIMPGNYTGRTRHIHVKVQAPNGPILTTQLYFPDDAGNASDGIFDQSLLMDVADVDDTKSANFIFVVET